MTSQEPARPAGGLGGRLAGFANWFNENVVGSPWTYLACIILVVAADLMIPVQGFGKWNLTTGLFFNTQSSNIELVTGVGAVVGVYAVRRTQKQQRKDVGELHGKLDAHRRDVRDLHRKIDALTAAAGGQDTGGAEDSAALGKDSTS